MARYGLVAFGIILIVGIFFVTQVFVTPQQKQQIQLANELCGLSIWGLPLGQIGQSLSAEAASKCEQAGFFSQLFSMAPFIYIIGFILLVAGLAMGRGNKEIVREIVKEPVYVEKEKSIPKSEPKKEKFKYCANCGTKVTGKFCPECGKEAG